MFTIRFVMVLTKDPDGNVTTMHVRRTNGAHPSALVHTHGRALGRISATTLVRLIVKDFPSIIFQVYTFFQSNYEMYSNYSEWMSFFKIPNILPFVSIVVLNYAE